MADVDRLRKYRPTNPPGRLDAKRSPLDGWRDKRGEGGRKGGLMIGEPSLSELLSDATMPAEQRYILEELIKVSESVSAIVEVMGDLETRIETLEP